jgi:hypothetical protein
MLKVDVVAHKMLEALEDLQLEVVATPQTVQPDHLVKVDAEVQIPVALAVVVVTTAVAVAEAVVTVAQVVADQAMPIQQ